ncbi:MAG: hypothetical protein ACRD0K_26905 [Egibacteraceae bacterium]
MKTILAALAFALALVSPAFGVVSVNVTIDLGEGVMLTLTDKPCADPRIAGFLKALGDWQKDEPRGGSVKNEEETRDVCYVDFSDGQGGVFVVDSHGGMGHITPDKLSGGKSVMLKVGDTAAERRASGKSAKASKTEKSVAAKREQR